MAAGVGKTLVAGGGVGGAGQAVQLPNEGYVGAILFADAGPQAGDGQTLPSLQPQLFQAVRYHLGSAVFVVALFGVVKQVLRQSLKLLCAAVQNRKYLLFDYVHRKHSF